MAGCQCAGTHADGYAEREAAKAMVAYGLPQNGTHGDVERQQLRSQLLRYSELDTLAMVMAWDGLQELC